MLLFSELFSVCQANNFSSVPLPSPLEEYGVVIKTLLIIICFILVQQNLIKQTEIDAVKKIEKRSLLPRMIYLSIYSASASVKENIEANGSAIDPTLPLELKILLERYARIMKFPFQDAVELVFGVSSGQKPLEVRSFSSKTCHLFWCFSVTRLLNHTSCLLMDYVIR